MIQLQNMPLQDLKNNIKGIVNQCNEAINKAQPLLNEPRNIKNLLAEIGLAVVALISGIGALVYIPALIINYHKTSRVGFFRQTCSSQLAEDVAKDLTTIKLEP